LKGKKQVKHSNKLSSSRISLQIFGNFIGVCSINRDNPKSCVKRPIEMGSEEI